MDKQMKGSSLKKIGALLPWLWLAAGYVLDMWFQLVPGKWIVDSDLASEMMLTKILNPGRLNLKPQLVLFNRTPRCKYAVVLSPGAAAVPG